LVCAWAGRHAIVDLSVTVVVLPIARLLLGLTWSHITSHIRTRLVTHEFASVGTNPFAYRTCLAQRREIFVDLTIAIVIPAIAAFGVGRAGLGCTLGFAAICRTHNGSLTTTGSFSIETRLAKVGKSFVDQSITVIVFAVTHFGRRLLALHQTIQRLAIGRTLVHARPSTLSLRHSAWLIELWKVFVGLSVAIIVFSVTRLTDRDNLSLTRFPLTATATNLFASLACPSPF
jgi:hypothetical protein